jgi:hypothetical protein
VSINPVSGIVTPVGPSPIVPPSIFAWSYNGNVYGDAISADGTAIFHLFRREQDHSYVLARISITDGTLVDAPTLINGVNSQLEFNTPLRMEAAL